MTARTAQASRRSVRGGEASRAPGRSRLWIRLGGAAAFVLVVAAVWLWTPLRDYLDVERLEAAVAPHRGAWYALPLVALAFAVLSHLLFPLTVMVLVSGMVFGPWLGSVYGLAGAMTSAAVSFGLGRLLGARGVEKLAGKKLKDIGRAIGENGVLATFLIRKVPAPYAIVNLMVGASPIRFLDFMLGTFLGVGVIVVVLSFLGHQALEVWHDPTPAAFLKAGALLLGSLIVAVGLDRLLRRRRRSRS